MISRHTPKQAPAHIAPGVGLTHSSPSWQVAQLPDSQKPIAHCPLMPPPPPPPPGMPKVRPGMPKPGSTAIWGGAFLFKLTVNAPSAGASVVVTVVCVCACVVRACYNTQCCVERVWDAGCFFGCVLPGWLTRPWQVETIVLSFSSIGPRMVQPPASEVAWSAVACETGWFSESSLSRVATRVDRGGNAWCDWISC